jgi:hypothetical protein
VVLLGFLIGFRRQRFSVSRLCRQPNSHMLMTRFIGTLKHFCLMGVDGEPAVGSARLPSIVYAAYQGMFAVSRLYYARLPLISSSSPSSSPLVVSLNEHESDPSWYSSLSG